MILKTFTACLIGCFGGVSGLDAVEGARCELARDGVALQQVIIGAVASAANQESAKELADFLGRISGAKFEVAVGDGKTGIAVGCASDFPIPPVADVFGDGALEREDYILRSHAAGVTLIGATDLAVSHAVWDMLYRLGVRQYFPGETWEIVPKSPQLGIALDRRESPSFHARRIWYNWGFWDHNQGPYNQWCRRNRAVKGFELSSGHSYGNIWSANRAAFDAHPEFYAQVNGKREYRGGDTKFCIGNGDLRKLVVDHAVRTMKAQPALDSISMDPSDGGGWCECQKCKAVGSVSDRVVTLANEVATAINDLDLGTKAVGIYAYNEHSAPPSINVHSQVIPSATTAFIRGGFTFDQIVDGWQAQGATMGVYDYLTVVAWDWNLPCGGKASRPSYLASFLPHIYKKGVRFYDAESGDCWGPCGLGYHVASRLLWDIDDAGDVDFLVADFLDKSFGGARAPMGVFYALITEDQQRRSPSDLLGRMYRQLEKARAATDDPAVLKRVDALILYTRHAELYYAFAAGNGSVEDVARHAYRMRGTMMVHSYGLWARLINQQAALTADHPLKDDSPFLREDLDRILAQGVANNQPVELGFVSKTFSDELVPAAEALEFAPGAGGLFPQAPQDQQNYAIWIAEGANALDLEVTVQKVWANRNPKMTLSSPLEVSLKPVAEDESYLPDGKARTLKLKTPYSGLHRILAVDGGDHTRINWPEGMPVTIESGIDSPGVTSHFRGEWTLVFYVPKGTKVIGGWASRIANWAPRISGTLVNPDGEIALDFGTIEESWFNVPVPDGMDGKIWRFEKSQGQRLLMTVPPYLARRGCELLLPSEVVDRDREARK